MAPRKRGYGRKRSKAGAKKRYGKRYGRKRGYGKLGGFTIQRRCALANVVGTGSLGVVTTSSSTNVILGTPTVAQSGISGYYDVPFAFVFQLGDLQGYTDLTAIADKYKIVKADIIAQTTQNYGTSGALPPAFIEYVHDWDDPTPADALTLCQKMGLKNKGFNSRGQIFMRTYPKVAQTIYSSPTSSYAVPGRPVYINSTYYNVPHYGLKGVIRNMLLSPTTSSLNSITFDIKMTVHLKDLQ